MSERAPLPIEERSLTEVDNLNRHRDAEGKIMSWASDEVFKNLVSAIKEGGIPHAVHVSEQPYVATGERDELGMPVMSYAWLGQTAVQHAVSGYAFHKDPAAHMRVDVEVDEAQYDQANLRPGFKKIFISPRMSEVDATYEVAKREHLGEDDAIRVSEVITDEQSNIVARRMESSLVRDIPLAAWVGMLKDPNNIFGKPIKIDNEASALSVMKVHRELEVPADKLPEGVVSLVEAVIDYIDDPIDRLSVERQLERFREDQVDLHETATYFAKDWLIFQEALAESLHTQESTPEVERFIAVMQDRFTDEDLQLITARHLGNNTYLMDRELASLLANAKQYTLFAKAGAVTESEQITSQLNAEEQTQLKADIELAKIAEANGDIEGARALQAHVDRRVAAKNLKVGGGCPGEFEGLFGDKDTDPLDSTDNTFDTRDKMLTTDSEKKIGKIRKGKCVVDSCPTRPKEVTVGGCGVCLGRCQKMFDRGKDPTKNWTTQQESQKDSKAVGEKVMKALVYA